MSLLGRVFTKKSSWTVSKKSKISTAAHHSITGMISSLFMKNPEIPVMKKDNVESAQGNVFSAQSFGSFKIHKRLVCCFIISSCVS
jgi:hypothetical protein